MYFIHLIVLIVNSQRTHLFNCPLGQNLPNKLKIFKNNYLFFLNLLVETQFLLYIFLEFFF